jgi:DNA-binding MarR family transcriptional regulator
MTPALRGVQRRVWEWLDAEHPRDGEFRPLKKAGLAMAWGVRPNTITDAVVALERAGYIERGPKADKCDTYRWRDVAAPDASAARAA